MILSIFGVIFKIIRTIILLVFSFIAMTIIAVILAPIVFNCFMFVIGIIGWINILLEHTTK
jgi:hypothetical protein